MGILFGSSLYLQLFDIRACVKEIALSLQLATIHYKIIEHAHKFKNPVMNFIKHSYAAVKWQWYLIDLTEPCKGLQ